MQFINKAFKSRTIKNLGLIGMGNSLIVLFGFIFTVIVARQLTPAVFGDFITLITLVSFFVDITELGLSASLPRFLSSREIQDTQKKYSVIKSSLLIELAALLIIAPVLFIFSTDLAIILFENNISSYANLIKLSILGVFVSGVYALLYSIFTSQEQFTKGLLLSAFYSLPRIFILIILLKFTQLNLTNTILIYFSGTVIADIVGLGLLNLKKIISSTIFPLAKILSFSISLAVNKFTVTLFARLDILQLSWLSSSFETGIYSSAARVALIFPLITTTIATVTAPRFSLLTPSQGFRYSFKIYKLLAIIILGTLVLILFSPYIINFVYGKSYLPAVNVLRILLVANLPLLLSIPVNQLLTYTYKKPAIIVQSSFIQLICIFIINLLFIPRYGSLIPPISIGTGAALSLIYNSFRLFSLSKHGK